MSNDGHIKIKRFRAEGTAESEGYEPLEKYCKVLKLASDKPGGTPECQKSSMPFPTAFDLLQNGV